MRQWQIITVNSSRTIIDPQAYLASLSITSEHNFGLEYIERYWLHECIWKFNLRSNTISANQPTFTMQRVSIEK